jgi:2-oxoglutarate ferredoxin oxidoreductase subunit alpha
LSEIPIEDKVVQFNFGNPSNEIMVLSWGSTKGAIVDAMDMLSRKGKAIGFLQIRLLHPFPTNEILKLIKDVRVLICVEMNYTSQLAALVRQHTGREVDFKIIKFNGRPMSSSEIYSTLETILEGKSERRIVLANGT